MAEIVRLEALITHAFPPDSDAPGQFLGLLDRSGTGANAPAIDDFLAAVDDSDYSLADWIDALLAFDRWLAEHDAESRSFANMSGYLACCSAVAPRTVGTMPALQDLLLQNLEEYGFDAAIPSRK